MGIKRERERDGERDEDDLEDRGREEYISSGESVGNKVLLCNE